jgi:DNA-binding CsgD family transcriptional regulator
MINTNEILEKAREYWTKELQNHTLEELPENLRKMMLWSPVTESNRTAISIFNLKKFEPEFASANTFETLGHSAEDYTKNGLQLLVNNLDDLHKSFPLFITNWFENNFPNVPYEDRVNLRLSFCGLRYHHPTKKWIHLLLQQFFFEVDTARNQMRICTAIADISHLVRQDKMWLRISYGATNQYVEAIEYNSQYKHKGDIISIREMDILLLLIEGLDVEDIGKKLFISPNTVKNHRQNMIKTLGVKDTTALIQICRLCGIV